MQIHSSQPSEIDREGNLMMDMVGGYTALEGRWSRGRQVEIIIKNPTDKHFGDQFNLAP